MKITQKRLIEIIKEEIAAAVELEEVVKETTKDDVEDLEESYSIDEEIDEDY